MMRYDTLMTIRVSADTAAAIAAASAARGLKLSEYLRNAISLSLAMDNAIQTESPST